MATRIGLALTVTRHPIPAELDELEKSVADELRKLEPERRDTAGLHKSLRQLALTSTLVLVRAPRLSATAFEAAMRRVQSSPLDEALKHVTRVHVAALKETGLSPSAIDVLKSWLDLTVDLRVLERQIEMLRIVDSACSEGDDSTSELSELGDPRAPLTAAELGKALGGLGDESIRQRERAGKLFSILRPGRKRGREYPAFQAWPGIAGEPLERAMAALGSVTGTDAYGFLTSPTDLLGWLTPIEVMLGRQLSSRALEPEAAKLLASSSAERLEAVEKAAAAVAAQLSA